MVSEQVDPIWPILWLGTPLASAAVLPIACLGRVPFFCLPSAHGARHFFFPPRAQGVRRFSARRAALVAARRPALPVVRPVARDGALLVVRPEACGGFVARRAQPPLSRRQLWRPWGPTRPPPFLQPASCPLPPPVLVHLWGGGYGGGGCVHHPLLLLLRLPLLQLLLRGVGVWEPKEWC
ncbi:unnamed protein product [Closterium sp. NIES-54]